MALPALRPLSSSARGSSQLQMSPLTHPPRIPARASHVRATVSLPSTGPGTGTGRVRVTGTGTGAGQGRGAMPYRHRGWCRASASSGSSIGMNSNVNSNINSASSSSSSSSGGCPFSSGAASGAVGPTDSSPFDSGVQQATWLENGVGFIRRAVATGIKGTDTTGAADKEADKEIEDERSFIERNVSNIFNGADPLAPIKLWVPFHFLIGFGMLVSVLITRFFSLKVSLIIGAALFIPFIAGNVLKSIGVLPNPDEKDVILGKMTDKIKGDFCVFMLGARSNAAVKPNAKFNYIGLNFIKMMRELERLPGSAGYLGGEWYVAANPRRGSNVMAVTFWRSYDHLMRYTHDEERLHTPAMRETMSKLSSMPEVGIWHEVYNVKPGQHESVYQNCPPLGLGAAAGLVRADGTLKTSRGRLEASG